MLVTKGKGKLSLISGYQDEHGTHKYAHGSWILCLLENNTFSVLHYVIKVTLHSDPTLHRFEIHSALELNFEHGFIRLPPPNLASLICEVARWQYKILSC